MSPKDLRCSLDGRLCTESLGSDFSASFGGGKWPGVFVRVALGNGLCMAHLRDLPYSRTAPLSLVGFYI